MTPRETCAKAATWPEVRPYGVRLSCCLPAGHSGECLCADIEYLPKPEEQA
jgi:hypothetical protein